ncbi:MAG: phosphoribosylglycinamide formyltransferase [Alphaproteobacteria bacterium]|nr:phosphoribosylglycinamide formyltransferase [Alphaproteobacteria bacterium]MBV9418324.1 phosphoribosylglycinamide formyltransferase [Alphaproteobacteria bacterium]
MTTKKRVAILISGRGTNMAALMRAAWAEDYPAKIVLVFSNVETAQGLKTAQAAGIRTQALSHKEFATREDFDAALDEALTHLDVDLICEAGFMRIHSDPFVQKWEGKILNIHPSLLPSFKGLRVHEQTLEAGVRISGCTVHFVTPALDGGPIIAQAAVPVLPNDTPETLAARILIEEHRIYPEALRMVCEGKVRLENGRAVFA